MLMPSMRKFWPKLRISMTISSARMTICDTSQTSASPPAAMPGAVPGCVGASGSTGLAGVSSVVSGRSRMNLSGQISDIIAPPLGRGNLPA